MALSKPFLYDRNDDQFQFSKLKETKDDYSYDKDDTPSLCDLPIFSFSSPNQYEYQEESNAVFEFFRGDRADFQDNNDIVFCGKLISPKDLVDRNTPIKPKKQRALFKWKSFKITPFRKSEPKNKLLYSTRSDSFEKMMSAMKVSTLVTCPTESKWFLFLFGHTKFPQVLNMDLSDLKNRQQRRVISQSSSTKLRATTEGGLGGSGTGRGIWSLLKESATSVRMTNANDFVKAVACMTLM